MSVTVDAYLECDERPGIEDLASLCCGDELVDFVALPFEPNDRAKEAFTG